MAGPGRPVVKAAAGAAAQADLRRSERLRHRHKTLEAEELLKKRLEEEGAAISDDYAAKQAKAIANMLFASAGSITNAEKVLGKLKRLPEIRALDELFADADGELKERCIDNFIDFIRENLSATGTRHAEDQNVLDALLTAVVDVDMIKDRLISAVAKLIGARWEAVKSAVLTRLKLNDEKREGTDGIWTRRARETRCDKYELQGFYEFCHDETFFKFSSRHSVPLRKHIDVGEYRVHWAREVPNLKKDAIKMFREEPGAEKYRQQVRDANGGHLPEDSVLNENICFCLIRPTYDQCADPIYTMLRANLPMWNRERTLWHEKESKCDASCACKSAPWFRSFTASETALHECLLCKPIACPELMVDDDKGIAPELHKPECTRGECDCDECLQKKLELLRACPTERGDPNRKVRYRKYAKMPRKRADGSEYTEVEFVYVLETCEEMEATMLSATETYLEHRRPHLWAVRQRKLVIKKLKESGGLVQLAEKLGLSEEAVMKALLDCKHEEHRTITGHDIIVFTDFAAKVKYENASSSTCDHPNQGTLCIAVVLHSPAERLVTKDVTQTEVLATGLESVAVSDSRKAPQHVKMGKRETEEVKEHTLLCDVFCGYSEESGNARFDQTLMRDIICYYKFGHIKYATAATSRGEPIPIGESAASAKVSEYDKERLERLESFRAQEERRKEGEALLCEQRAAEAAAESTPAAAEEPEGGKKVLKKRKSAGTSKTKVTAEEGDEGLEQATASSDRRGRLPLMRLLLKWTDGCGVQYVQREAALGTASLYGDIEELAKQQPAIDAKAAFGVIGMHVVFEPYCFKYIHDAAGKVFADNQKHGVRGRDVTITDVEQHYDHNAATMLAPKKDTYASFSANDFTFSNYIHLLYRKTDFIKLEADAVNGIKSWRLTEGGTDSRATGRGGHGGGLGYKFRSQPHVCFCGGKPCPHQAFTGAPSEHQVLPCTQEKADRVQATDFIGAIKEGTALASKGATSDSTSGGEALWLSIAKGTAVVNDKAFAAAGGAGTRGTRTIAANWQYVDIDWLVKIKVDSNGDVHYEKWSQPQGERTRHVLTKPKILTVPIELRVVERDNAPTRYVLSATDYQRLVDAVKG